MTERFKKWVLLLFIFFTVWASYSNAKVFNQTDSLWSIYTTLSLVREGNLDLDEYKTLFPKAFNANLIEVKEHTYNYYPYGVSLLAYPYIWSLNQYYLLKEKDLYAKIISSSTVPLEKNVSAILLSFSACIFFLLAQKELNSTKKSLLLLFLFSFCTLNFSVLSRGLWQHTGSIFLITIVLYCIHSQRRGLLIFSALPLFSSYVVRPTNLLPILILGLIVIYHLQRKSFYFLGLGIIILSAFFYTNLVVFGSIYHPYYDFRKIGGSTTYLEALVGNLFSPARGLFIYSPIFLFSFLGFYLKIRSKNLEKLDIALVLIFFLHWVSVSRNLNWWGGHSYGYRLLSDMIPFLIYLCIFFLKDFDWNLKSPTLYIFILSVFISFYINSKGAYDMNSYFWNLTPKNIDNYPERLWDWKDLPFLR